MTSELQDILPPSLDPTQNLSESPDPPQASIKKPSWTKFLLKKFDEDIKYSAALIMEHYLVVLLRDRHGEDRVEGDEPATLLAFNLLDNSVQKAKLDDSLFYYAHKYSLLRYGENKIIQYGGETFQGYEGNTVCITVESFQPFKVKCEEIRDLLNCFQYTAQIHKDYLYDFGRTDNGICGARTTSLKRFDLKNNTWESCETTGEAPMIFNYPQSFIHQDHFYMYGVEEESDLWMLNLTSMHWTKIEQEKTYLQPTDGNKRMKIGEAIFHNQLVILGQSKTSRDNKLCFLNLDTRNTWSTFDIEDTRGSWNWKSRDIAGSLMIYKNLVLTLVEEGYEHNLMVAMMNLDDLGITTPKSAEEEYFSSLFMSEAESDLTFKVQDKLIPAHKQVLMKRSRYFSNVFDSGMSESTQDIIEISECKHEIFEEYLRFVYQEKVQIDTEERAMELYILADKYVEDDLCEKCVMFLTHNISRAYFYEIVEFACERNLTNLQNCCVTFVEQRLAEYFSDMYGLWLIEFLAEHEEEPEFKHISQAFTSPICNSISKHFFNLRNECKEEEDMETFENYLVENIKMNTISVLIHFLNGYKELPEDQENLFEKEFKTPNKYRWEADSYLTIMKTRRERIGGDHFEKCTARIKEAVFRFIQQNKKTIMTSEMANCFSNGFLKELCLYAAENFHNGRRNKKRIEAIEDEVDGGGHLLKKTKKSDPTYETL